MEALEYVDQPDYSGILLRATYQNLAHEPDGLMPRLADWLRPTAARYAASTRTWHFPSGAVLTFGYLAGPNDHYRYAGPSYQYVGMDEASEIRESSYRYLFSRLRRTAGSQIPIRFRAASNPGGRSHDFLRDRFHLADGPSGLRATNLAHRRKYIPAKLGDNPHLDQAEYAETLAELDPVTRQRLLNGDWTIAEGGNLFRHGWFQYADTVPKELTRVVRSWDLAAAEPTTSSPDPDWTAGVKLGEADGRWYVLDVIRLRGTPLKVEETIAAAAAADGPNVAIYIEQEPGASGKHIIDQYQRRVLAGYTVRGYRPSGSKVDRARPLSAVAEAGNLVLVKAGWNSDLTDELVMFPQKGAHDDQVDALSGGWFVMARRREWKVH